jgi:hypothetical protein
MSNQDPEAEPMGSPAERAEDALRVRATAVLGQLRVAIAEVIAALGNDIRQPRDLKAVLGIHQTLAWRVFRFANDTNALADPRNLPGGAGLSTFLAAARTRGVPSECAEKVNECFGRFRALVDSQAGDRAALELMLAGLNSSAAAASPASKTSRRNGYLSNSAVWGTQMRMKLMCQVIAPSAHAGLLDFILIRGFVGMRRLRQSSRLSIMPLTIIDSARVPPGRDTIAALDPEHVSRGLALLPQFCSKPFPDLRVAKNPAGASECQLGETPIGSRDGATLITGQLFRAAGSRYRSDACPHGNTALSIRQPIESALIDIWVHRELVPDIKPQPLLYSESSGVAPDDQLIDHADLLPLSERVERAGQGLSAAGLVGLPRYRDLMEFAFARADWNPQDFELLRLRQAYPAMPTSLVMRFELPPEPL